MKHCNSSSRATLVALIALLFVASAGSAFAGGISSSRIVHTQKKSHVTPPNLGREFWFSIPLNYGQNLGGEYFRVYITSPSNTNAFVQLGKSGRVFNVPVPAYKIGT